MSPTDDMSRVLLAVKTPGGKRPEKGQMRDLLWIKLIDLAEADLEALLTVSMMFPTMADDPDPANLAMQIVMSPEVDHILGQIEWTVEPPAVPNNTEILHLIDSATKLTLREFLEGLP